MARSTYLCVRVKWLKYLSTRKPNGGVVSLLFGKPTKLLGPDIVGFELPVRVQCHSDQTTQAGDEQVTPSLSYKALGGNVLHLHS